MAYPANIELTSESYGVNYEEDGSRSITTPNPNGSIIVRNEDGSVDVIGEDEDGVSESTTKSLKLKNKIRSSKTFNSNTNNSKTKSSANDLSVAISSLTKVASQEGFSGNSVFEDRADFYNNTDNKVMLKTPGGSVGPVQGYPSGSPKGMDSLKYESLSMHSDNVNVSQENYTALGRFAVRGLPVSDPGYGGINNSASSFSNKEDYMKYLKQKRADDLSIIKEEGNAIKRKRASSRAASTFSTTPSDTLYYCDEIQDLDSLSPGTDCYTPLDFRRIIKSCDVNVFPTGDSSYSETISDAPQVIVGNSSRPRDFGCKVEFIPKPHAFDGESNIIMLAANVLKVEYITGSLDGDETYSYDLVYPELQDIAFPVYTPMIMEAEIVVDSQVSLVKSGDSTTSTTFSSEAILNREEDELS